MGAFFEKVNADVKKMLACFDFLLGFLAELKPDDDVYQALMDKKRFYFDNLQKAIRSELQLEKSNLETMILSGGRVVYVDKQDARRENCADRSDRLCRPSAARRIWTRGLPRWTWVNSPEKNGLKTVFRILS